MIMLHSSLFSYQKSSIKSKIGDVKIKLLFKEQFSKNDCVENLSYHCHWVQQTGPDHSIKLMYRYPT